jgi:hypothetical protein
MHRNFFREGSLRNAELWLLICLMLITASSVWAQEKKPVQPPPKPSDEGPSLQVTMKFIQDKMNQEGSVTFIQSSHDTITGESGGPWKHSSESTVAEIDPAGGLSLKTVHVWPVAVNSDIFTWQLSFKDVQKLEVLTQADYANRSSAKAGKPEWVTQIDPSVYVLVISMASGRTVSVHAKMIRGDQTPTEEKDANWTESSLLLFRDEETANRIAKAMVHAVELCGGGSKDPF